MTQNTGDAAPKGGGGKRSTGTSGGKGISATQVVDYLERHPEFLAKHAQLLETLHAPARQNGDGIVDLQQYMVERLRDKVEDVTAARDELVITGRNNLATQARIHQAILALLATRSFEHFVETITTDLSVILDLDVVTIGVEQTGDNPSTVSTVGVYRLEAGMVDHLLGPTRDIELRPDVEGDLDVFGAGAGLVASDALLRLSISPSTPPALLAFGSRQPGHFDPGQGTELLAFLARVIESLIRGWLRLPG